MKRRLPTVAPSPLPPLYAAWMEELLTGPLPIEEHATCSDCAMTMPAGGASGEGSFDSATKCCTYQPRLPNFLLGRILGGPRGPGRTSVEKRIAAQLGVTPLGIARPPVYGAIFGAAMPGGFGRTPSLLCPHYVDEGGGLCGIWQNRNATCSTWYCKHVRGSVGARSRISRSRAPGQSAARRPAGAASSYRGFRLVRPDLPSAA